MPATQRGQAYKLGPGKWGLRYYNVDGKRHRKSPLRSKSEALDHFRQVIEPQLRGEAPAQPELTLSQFVDRYLERHAANVRPRTIETLRERLVYATRAFGEVPLRDLERMAGEIAAWAATQSDRSRHDRWQALRQVLAAAVRWGYMAANPAKLAGRNPQPPPRPIRTYTYAELEAIAAELSSAYASLPMFVAATGLRPENGKPSNAATWIAPPGCSTSGAPCRAARWSSLPRRPAAAARCPSRRGRSRRLTRCRHGSTRRT